MTEAITMIQIQRSATFSGVLYSYQSACKESTLFSSDSLLLLHAIYDGLCMHRLYTITCEVLATGISECNRLHFTEGELKDKL